MDYAVIWQSITFLFCARCLQCLKICTVNFIFSKRGNMLHSGTPLIVAIIMNGCRIWKKSTVSNPHKILSMSASKQQIFTECFYFAHIPQHHGNFWWNLSNAMCFVLVYCCVDMLMTSCFGMTCSFWDAKELSLRNFVLLWWGCFCICRIKVFFNLLKIV